MVGRSPTKLWLSSTLIGAIVALSLIMTHMQQVNSALPWVITIIGGGAGLAVLYVCYNAWHTVSTKHLERKALVQEIARADIDQSNRQALEQRRLDLELARIQAEERRMELEHERLMMAAIWNSQHVIVPEGSTAVFTDQDKPYIPIQSPRSHPQIAAPLAREMQQEEERPIPAPIDVFTLMQTGQWALSNESLLLAVGPDGPVTVDYALAWHIALAGSTGGGKTNELRLLLAQMVGFYDTYYISPAFAPVKANHEDWRQIQERLAGPVARTGAEIELRLHWACNTLKARQDAEFNGDYSWKGKKIYVVIDEYKEVIARYKEAPDDVSVLLRQARQYEIFIVVAAQDFLIKSIGGDSGARDCYRTALYFGGDPNTCRALLDAKGTFPFEEDLGKSGHMVLRTKSTKMSQARAPFMSNRAIYIMLGWPDDPILDDAPVTAFGTQPGRSGTPDNEHNHAPLPPSPKRATMTVEAGDIERTTGSLARDTDEPVEAVGRIINASPHGPELGKDDWLMTDDQISKFISEYRKNPSNKKQCLKNAGCNNHHYKHANWLLSTYNLEGTR
jgi:hypothetical protein